MKIKTQEPASKLKCILAFIIFKYTNVVYMFTQPSEEAQVQTFLQQRARSFDHPRLRGQLDFESMVTHPKTNQGQRCLTWVIRQKALS